MYKISKWKLIISIFLTILAIIYVFPNVSSNNSKWFPDNKINLGLDLRGGSHLLLNVDFESYMHEISNSIADSFKKNARGNKLGYKNLQIENNQVTFELLNDDDFKSVKKIARDIDYNLSAERTKDGKVALFYNEYEINQLQDKVIDQSIEIIRMRVDSSGTKEPTIQRQGVSNILLQVPGEENPNELKRVLGKTAKLTFNLVDETANIERARNGYAPSGSKIVKSDEDGLGILVIKKKNIVSGDELTNAQVDFQNNAPVIKFSFNQLGAKKFGDVTSKNTGRRLAIILDDRVISAPVINQPILGGDGIISGNFSVESANELALMLRAGALPTQLKIIEERTIGPNLGADSIESGKKAAIAGFALVVIFMIWTYGMLGIFANIALIIALLYIFAILTILQTTLTLPGIAGIILTIGMAVDANVLIYERIREEIEKGSSNLYAVKVGFDSAFATIMDSNITTLIAAFLLYSFGVGAIKGFAVTLTVGIVASMYSALIITKLMIDIWLLYFKPKNIGL